MSRDYEYDKNTDYDPTTDRYINTTSPDSGEYVESGYVTPVKETEEERMKKIRREKIENEENREAKYALDDYERDQRETKARADRLKKQEEEKLEAIDLARERYLGKSGLYKLFHRRLSDKKAAKMTTAEIKKMYGGIEENKKEEKVSQIKDDTMLKDIQTKVNDVIVDVCEKKEISTEEPIK